MVDGPFGWFGVGDFLRDDTARQTQASAWGFSGFLKSVPKEGCPVEAEKGTQKFRELAGRSDRAAELRT